MRILALVCRIFVATWNVGGKTPDNGLNLEELLQVEGASDIYVLGYDVVTNSHSCLTFFICQLN